MGISERLHDGIDRVLDAGPLRRLRMHRYEHYFTEGRPFLAHRGVYATLEEARQHIPGASSRGYDSPAAASLHLDRLERVYPSDYPAMLWLARLFREGCTTVFDLGGNVGVGYYSFGRFVDFPPALRWLVCEVSAIVNQGRSLAAERDARRQLAFTERFEDAEGFDLLLACGALQYLPAPMSESLGKLSSKPRHLILNSVALHPDRSFFTVQNIHGDVFVPYRISRERDFILGYTRLGYELVDLWAVPEKKCTIPFAPEYSVQSFCGFYFRLRTPP